MMMDTKDFKKLKDCYYKNRKILLSNYRDIVSGGYNVKIYIMAQAFMTIGRLEMIADELWAEFENYEVHTDFYTHVVAMREILKGRLKELHYKALKSEEKEVNNDEKM